MDSERINRIAKMVLGMATIWNTPPYKVSVYADDHHGSHKEKHLHVKCGRDKSGNLKIEDGSLLTGELSKAAQSWCKRVILNPSNKKRILKMIEERDFYRLDRPEEVRNHPLGDVRRTTHTASGHSYDDEKIVSAEAAGGYLLRVKFADGSLKEFDMGRIVNNNSRMYAPMIEDPSLIYRLKVEPDGHGIYWDDVMGLPSDGIYEMGTEVEELK